MNKRIVILILSIATLLCACDKNKQKQQQQPAAPAVPADTTVVTQPVASPDTLLPVIDTIVHAIDTTSIVEPIDTLLHDIDSIIRPAAGWQPKYQSAYGRGVVTILYKQRKFTSPVVVNYIADSIITASIQPMFGIEMYRIEAHTTKAQVIEKLNRRYVEMTYDQISEQAKRNISFPLIEQLVEEVGLTYPVGQDTTLSFSGVEANILLQYRTTNQPVVAFPLPVNGYQQTTLKALLSK